MRQAFELGWANAYVYARQRPYIEFMDDILFQAPVEIGSLLYFHSQVTYLVNSPFCQPSHKDTTTPLKTLPGNTTGGSIAVPLTSCLTGLD
jgi:hypothetical protein